MIFKTRKSDKSTFAITLLCCFFIASCTTNMTEENTKKDTINSTKNTINTLGINTHYCSQNSEKVSLDLTDITLIREKNIPLMYQGTNNIEGPVWYKGALYYTNMGSHLPDKKGFVLSNQTTIWKWIPGNKPQIWLQDTLAGVNGLALNNKGELIAGRQLDGSISKIDWQTKQITPMVKTYQQKRFNSPNDLTISDDNTVYFTDPNWNTPSNIDVALTQGGGLPGSLEQGQRIYRLSPNGEVNATKVTELIPALRDKPNGIILSLDEKQLIVGGLQGLWAFDLNAGMVSNPQKILETPIDGLGKDCSGNIYVTTTRTLPERIDGQVIVILNKFNKEIGALNVPGIHIVTNIAFGGNDRKTLFVTGLTAPMNGEKVRFCGKKPCLQAGIYTTQLNVEGFPY